MLLASATSKPPSPNGPPPSPFKVLSQNLQRAAMTFVCQQQGSPCSSRAPRKGRRTKPKPSLDLRHRKPRHLFAVLHLSEWSQPRRRRVTCCQPVGFPHVRRLHSITVAPHSRSSGVIALTTVAPLRQRLHADDLEPAPSTGIVRSGLDVREYLWSI